MKKNINKRKYDARDRAQLLQDFGQRNDKILAHINPEEAQMLQEMFGADINPYTGLPQFGLFDSIGDFFTKGIPNFFKKTIPDFFVGKKEEPKPPEDLSSQNTASDSSQVGFGNYLNYQPTYANKILENNTIGRPKLDSYQPLNLKNNNRIGMNYNDYIPFPNYEGNFENEQQ